MGGTQFLVWGMTLVLSGCSLDNALPRTNLWFSNQITPMIEGFRRGIIQISSKFFSYEAGFCERFHTF